MTSLLSRPYIGTASPEISHYETEDALMERDYAMVGIRSRRRYTTTEAEHAAFWDAVNRRTEPPVYVPVAGDIIGYDRACNPIYA